MSTNPNFFEVEIIFANQTQQVVTSVQITDGCTVKQVIQASGILIKQPEIDLSKNKVGIFGKIVSLETVLQPGDRIEIYSPLIIDPKQARKQRASKHPLR